MEHQPRPANGGEHHHQDVNSYGTDDPEAQAHIENARFDAARERQRDRANLERLIELGMTPEDAELFIEFENYVTQRTADAEPGAETLWPALDADTSTPAEREQQRHQPRVYVADLASAQRGISHGLWIDAHQQSDELDADIAAMLDSSPTLPGLPWDQAWAVHSAEDFAGLDLNGVTDTVLIAELAKGIADFGAAYAAWVGLVGIDDRDQLGRFEDHHVGSYDTAEAWMREVADDLGWRRERQRITDPLLSPYVTLDYAAMAEDAARSWDAVTGIDGRLYVFMR